MMTFEQNGIDTFIMTSPLDFMSLPEEFHAKFMEDLQECMYELRSTAFARLLAIKIHGHDSFTPGDMFGYITDFGEGKEAIDRIYIIHDLEIEGTHRKMYGATLREQNQLASNAVGQNDPVEMMESIMEKLLENAGKAAEDEVPEGKTTH